MGPQYNHECIHRTFFNHQIPLLTFARVQQAITVRCWPTRSTVYNNFARHLRSIVNARWCPLNNGFEMSVGTRVDSCMESLLLRAIPLMVDRRCGEYHFQPLLFTKPRLLFTVHGSASSRFRLYPFTPVSARYIWKGSFHLFNLTQGSSLRSRFRSAFVIYQNVHCSMYFYYSTPLHSIIYIYGQLWFRSYGVCIYIDHIYI